MRFLAPVLLLSLLFAIASPAIAAEHRGTCWITEIATFENRVHIRCFTSSPGSFSSHPGSNLPDPGVLYLAVDTAKSLDFANRVLAIAETAVQIKAYVSVIYESDTSQNPPGCLTADCRKLTAVTLSN